MNKLRLLLFEDCNRTCAGCCNKDFDLAALPIETDFSSYREVILTGGEPMLRPDIILKAIWDVREQTRAPIFLYTAMTSPRAILKQLITDHLTGVTVTLHEQKDVVPFKALNHLLKQDWPKNKSLRLNVFSNVSINPDECSGWIAKTGIKWIKDCPLPSGEVFKRYRRIT